MQSQEEIEACLTVGTPVIFYPGPQRKGVAHYKTVFRGWRRGTHIIADRPATETGVMANLREGMDCTLCFIREGKAWAFSTQVMSWDMSGPIQYTRLRWPLQIESTQFRQGERIEVSLPCKLRPEGGKMVMGTVEDMSQGGCGVHTVHMMEKGARVALSFTFPDGTGVHEVRTVIRNVRPRGNAFFLGLAFEEGQVAAVNDIAFFVTSRIERLRGGLFVTEAAPRVLIIDTNADRAGKILWNLNRRGVEGYIAHNVVEGFYRLRAVPPRMVVVGYDNADLPGSEVTRLIRSSETRRQLHILVYGGEDSAAEEAAKAAGADEHFPACPTLAPDLGAEIAKRVQ